MSEQEQIDGCEELVNRLGELTAGHDYLTIAAAFGHLAGRLSPQPDHMLAFFDTIAANASLYVACSCGECDQPTKH